MATPMKRIRHPKMMAIRRPNLSARNGLQLKLEEDADPDSQFNVRKG